ncbi:alpha/beta fold hydrolase [Actinokineospora enzanensis]|uniref:alpha/beta fold hydrolase n=1 Tax=Actinokineospora enzanensis TaxID=155975 RepID=UPI000525750D|nr:alpha/beta hydrolase family protein [Actinokineospora enzanensis]
MDGRSERGVCYRLRGDGPLLLLIPGGVGSSASYGPLAAALADEYRVLTFDRRGHFGSAGSTVADLSMSRHAADVRALLDEVGGGPALVFGSSAGAVIGLALVAEHPEVVAGVVAHEPPVVGLLPDAARWSGFAAEIGELYRVEGVGAAYARFAGTIGGGGLSVELEREWDVLFRCEWEHIMGYVPDIAALARAGRVVIPAVGVDSGDQYYARAAGVLAGRLGVGLAELPGGHLAPRESAGEFVDALRGVLAFVRG